MAQGREEAAPGTGDMTVTKCITIHTFAPECPAPSPEKWVNCVKVDSTTQQSLNTTTELQSAKLSHILLHINVPNQQPYHLPMLITPVLCVYLVTFDLRAQKESLSKIHGVMKNVYALHSYRSEAGEKNHLPKVLLVGMHADKVKDEDRSSFTHKLDERLKKMPYHRLVEKPVGNEAFWAVEGGNLSLSGNDALSKHIKMYGCSQQLEVHQWIVRHSELLDQEELQDAPCICYKKLKDEVGHLVSDATGLKFDDWLQFLHNYGFIVYHSVKVEDEAEEGREDHKTDKVVLLQPQCLCNLFAKVQEFCVGKDFYTITDLFARPDAYRTVGANNKEWFQHICIDMGLVVAVNSDYVFLMALKGGPPSCPAPDEYSVPPLLMTFRDSNHFIVEPEYLLPSHFFAAFVTKFLRALTPPKGTPLDVTVMEQHYMQVKKGTTVIHIVERDFCIEIGLQQLDVGKMADEKKVKKLYAFCRDVKRVVDTTAESITERLKLATSNIRYGLYHSREAEEDPVDSFAMYVPDEQEGPYLECFCCDGGVQPTTPLQRIWFVEDFPLGEVSVQTITVPPGSRRRFRKLQVISQELVPAGEQPQALQMGGQTQALQMGGQTQPLQTGGQTQPLQVGGQPQALQMGGQPQPLQMGGQTQPLQFERQPQPLQMGGQTQALQMGGQPQPLQVGGQPQPLQVGGQPQAQALQTQLGSSVAGRSDHLMLFRTHVSRKTAGNGRAVLEGVGLDAPTISACFTANPQKEEDAVQDGLIRWCGGKGTQPPTWNVLIAAMEYAEISQQDIAALKCTLAVASV